MKISLLLSVCSISLMPLAVQGAKCEINLNSDLPKKQPVYLKWKQENSRGRWTFLHPKGPSMILEDDDNILVACSGSKNYITPLKPNNETALAQGNCWSGTSLRIGNSINAASDIICDKTITGDIQTTTESCGGGAGTWSIIGFDLPDVGFIESYRVCYDIVSGSALLSSHTIPGSIANSQKESTRPAFKSTGTAPQVSPAIAYTQSEQKKYLGILLGSSAEASKYIYTNSYLARGHLAPDADFLFISGQYATYFYVNTAPEWQAVNAGNWLRIETLARIIANNRGEDINVYTGTDGVLQLPDVNGKMVPITLSDGGLIVPKWIWKIVFLPSTGSAIAFVSLNNPFVTEIAPEELLCKSVCEEAGFYNSAYENFSKGYTYCCRVEDLAATVKTVPELVVKDLLTYL